MTRFTVQPITDGPRGTVVLVDFMRFQPGPTITGLLRDPSMGLTVYRVDPVTDLSRHDGYIDLADIVRECADAVRARVATPFALIG